MLCEKCGKNNLSDAQECSFCGATMPLQEKCGGFADILTYTPPETSGFSGGIASTYSSTQTEGISEQEMKKIIKKTDNIIQFSQKNIIISLASVVLGLVIVFFSIYMISVNKGIATRIEKLEKSIELITGVSQDNTKADKNSGNKKQDKLQGLTSASDADNNENGVSDTSSAKTIDNLNKKVFNYSETNKENGYKKENLNAFITDLNEIKKSNPDDLASSKIKSTEKLIAEMYVEYFEDEIEKLENTQGNISKENIDTLKNDLSAFESANKEIIANPDNDISGDISDIKEELSDMYIKYFDRETQNLGNNQSNLSTLQSEYKDFEAWCDKLPPDAKPDEEDKEKITKIETILKPNA